MGSDPRQCARRRNRRINRLTIGLSIHYENTKDPELGFDRNFTRFADYSSDLDLLQVEDALVEDIGAQLSQDIFNVLWEIGDILESNAPLSCTSNAFKNSLNFQNGSKLLTGRG